jgi:hypothetical protein
MTELLVPLLVTLVASLDTGPTCHVPRSAWMDAKVLKRSLASEDNPASAIGVSSGRCYVAYSRDHEGRSVARFFDPASGAALQPR